MQPSETEKTRCCSGETRYFIQHGQLCVRYFFSCTNTKAWLRDARSRAEWSEQLTGLWWMRGPLSSSTARLQTPIKIFHLSLCGLLIARLPNVTISTQKNACMAFTQSLHVEAILHRSMNAMRNALNVATQDTPAQPFAASCIKLLRSTSWTRNSTRFTKSSHFVMQEYVSPTKPNPQAFHFCAQVMSFVRLGFVLLVTPMYAMPARNFKQVAFVCLREPSNWRKI